MDSGTRLGPYEIQEPLGAGGMGEVYRARDTTLDRDVAIKVLPADLADDAERLARLEREAKLLAAVSHANIAAVYGFGREASGPYIAMELVDGRPLSAELADGGLPADRALDIARQIAGALEAAHDRGVVHRDLKPANVLITPEGSAKVLDFGIAKSTVVPEGGQEKAEQPTTLTTAGAIVGTPRYMSPEQIRGEPVDAQSDVFAFGALLYELLTGRSAFGKETVADTLAAVLEHDPDWSALPSGLDSAIPRVLERCLRKDRRSRWHQIADVRAQIEEGTGPVAVERSGEARPPVGRGTRLPWVVASASSALVLILLSVGWWQSIWSGGELEAGLPVQTAILPPAGYLFDTEGGLALSPDGATLAFVATSDSQSSELWIRALGRVEPRRIEGTEGASFPFWAPDGENLGFFAGGELKRLVVETGSIETMAAAPEGRGGTWCAGDRIVFAPRLSHGLQEVAAFGGDPQELTTLDGDRGELEHRLPLCLPSGKHILMLAQTAEGGARDDDSHIDVVALATGERTELVRANSSMAYMSGHLFLWRAGDLVALPFDPVGLEVGSTTLVVAEDVAYNTSEVAVFSVGGENSIVYQAADPVRGRSRLFVVDEAGEQIGEESGVDLHMKMAVSPDGTQVVYEVEGPNDLWIQDLVRGAASRFTHADGDHSDSVWTHDGAGIVFATDRAGPWQVFSKRVGALDEEEFLFESTLRPRPADASPDGRYISVTIFELDTDTHIALYELATGTLAPLIDTPFRESDGQFSPDGSWLAYVSDETGRPEVYVSPLGPSGAEARYPVSNSGGFQPRWSPSGDRVFFVDPSGTLQSVTLNRDISGAGISRPVALFAIPNLDFDSPYDVLPNGRSFVISRLEESGTPDHVVLVQNWTPARSDRPGS